MAYKLKEGEKVRTTIAVKDSATVITAGQLVALSSGLIVAAAAASTRIAWCPKGAAAGTTECEVTLGDDFTLVGTADAVFAAAYRGGEYDINDTTQTIDWGASSTDVLRIGITADAGTVGSASNVEVRINKPLF
jgi:hypothetical protein